MKLDFAKLAQNLERRRCSHLFDIKMIEELIIKVKDLERKKIDRKALQNKITRTLKGKLTEIQRQELLDIKLKFQELNIEFRSEESKLLSLVDLLPNDISQFTSSEPQILYVDSVDDYAKVKEHDTFGVENDLIDFANAAKISGNSFYFLKNKAVWLEMALTMYALKFYESKGFRTITTPDIVYKHIKDACGFTPRNENEIADYSINDGDKVLCATAEIPLAGMMSNTSAHIPGKAILKTDKNKEFLKISHRPVTLHGYPKLYVGLGKAFRPETGSLNASSRGLYRVHQFSKIELFAFALPNQSNALFEYFVYCQQEFFKSLNFKLKIIEMPDYELGVSAHRKIDIEAFFPGRQKFGELSSTSNCSDFQSKRLKIKYQQQNVSRYFHTVNGTGCAIQRTIACGLEAWQNGKEVILPDVLSSIVGFNKLP